MSFHRRKPLTPLGKKALTALMSEMPEEEELTYRRAYDILARKEDLDQPGAEDIIERLYMHGHLYEVEGKIRLTDY
ncbi:hypothetical protein [Haladaptatus sp. DYF46]|uniref:hypothetical protein n=1 Tax=Haladaptatus sp. DYF46 TaxID=2886041 RepID=UPI001E2A3132|nr:hypothetical protein [Haladaptatus sp. DYF46]